MNRRTLLCAIGLVLALIPAFLFLTPAGYFASSDGTIHLYRLFELDRAIGEGVFFPRWFPLSAYGYGLPVLNYYPPLVYYLAEIFHLLGTGYITAIKLTIATIFVLAAFSMFLFARNWMNDGAAFVAAIAYAYSPYLLSDAYVRGNFPEMLAMSLLPLALWAVSDKGRKTEDERRKTKDESTFVLGPSSSVLIFAAIILSHHLTAMQFAALLIVYAAFVWVLDSGQPSAVSGQPSAISHQRSAVSSQRSAVSDQPSAVSHQPSAVSHQRSAVSSQRSAVSDQPSAVSHQPSAISRQRSFVIRLLSFVLSLTIALALAAFYWVPALGELNLVYVESASLARFLVSRLINPTDFFAPALAYTYIPQSDALKRAFGFPQTIMALLAGVVALVHVLRNTQHVSRFTFHVSGSKFEVQGSRFEVQGSRFEVQGSRITLSRSLAPTPSRSLAPTPSRSLALTPSRSLALTPSRSFALSLHALFFSLVVAFSIFMTLTPSAPLWYAIPLLRFMQFPWRFQILATLGIAFLMGVWAQWLSDALSVSLRGAVLSERSESKDAPKQSPHHNFAVPRAHLALTTVHIVFALTLVALGIANLPLRTFPLDDAQVDLTCVDDSDYVVAQMGWGWTREFLPAAVREFENIYAPLVKPPVPPPESTRAVPQVQIERDGLYARTLRVIASEPFELSLKTFFFSGWQAYVDDVPVRTYPRGSLGIVTVEVPAGEHRVVFRFEETPLRLAMNVVSLVTLLGILVAGFMTRHRASIALFGGLILVAVLFAARAVAPRAPTPTAVNATLDARVQLIGYSTERVSESLRVTLHWLALAEMDHDYHSYVHLLDAEGNLIAQSDGVPDQGLTPTTRWLPGEIVSDRRIIVLRDVSPGEYRLRVGMYLPREDGFENVGNPIELIQEMFRH